MPRIALFSLAFLIAPSAWSTTEARGGYTYSTSLVLNGQSMSSVSYGTGSNNVGGSNTIYALTSQGTTALAGSGPITVGGQAYTPQGGNTGTFIDTNPGNGNKKLLIVITITDTTTKQSGSITLGDSISGTIGGQGPSGFDPFNGSLAAGSYFVDANGDQTSIAPSLTLGDVTFTVPANGTFVDLIGELTSSQSPPMQLDLLISSVPEPSSLALAAVGGVFGLAFAGRRNFRGRERP